MTSPQFDPNRYKTAQRREWDDVALAWKKWWTVFERGAQPVSDRLVELAGAQPGHRVLDISTGIGEPAVTLARRIGPNGHVVATDQSPGMLAVAKERVAGETERRCCSAWRSLLPAVSIGQTERREIRDGRYAAER